MVIKRTVELAYGEMISLKELITNKKYKRISEEELSDIVMNHIEFRDYVTLEGDLAADKAYNLYLTWHPVGKRVKRRDRSNDI